MGQKRNKRLSLKADSYSRSSEEWWPVCSVWEIPVPLPLPWYFVVV